MALKYVLFPIPSQLNSIQLNSIETHTLNSSHRSSPTYIRAKGINIWRLRRRHRLHRRRPVLPRRHSEHRFQDLLHLLCYQRRQHDHHDHLVPWNERQDALKKWMACSVNFWGRMMLRVMGVGTEMGRRGRMREKKAWSSKLLRLVLGSDDECMKVKGLKREERIWVENLGGGERWMNKTKHISSKQHCVATTLLLVPDDRFFARMRSAVGLSYGLSLIQLLNFSILTPLDVYSVTSCLARLSWLSDIPQLPSAVPKRLIFFSQYQVFHISTLLSYPLPVVMNLDLIFKRIFGALASNGRQINRKCTSVSIARNLKIRSKQGAVMLFFLALLHTV